MTLDQLLALVSEENKEAVEVLFNGFATKIDSLSAEIAELEKKANNPEDKDKLAAAIKSRDNAKAQLTVVREALGLPADKEVTRELVDSHIADSSKGDAEKDRLIATLKTDVANLESTIESVKQEKEKLATERDQISEEAKFTRVFSDKMPSFKPASPRARVDIENLLREGAVLENGDIVYKDGDSAYIRVAGEKMTMKEKLAQIEANPDYQYLFETKASGGSGSGNGGGGGGVSKYDQRKRAANIA